MEITLDTNTLDKSDLVRRAQEVGLDLVVTTVTEREVRSYNTVMGSGMKTIPEVFVVGESPLGDAVLGSENDSDIFEDLLRIISNGSFPAMGNRESLVPGQRRQLRDAMAFASHVRAGRDIFVTDDKRGFIRHGRRERLEHTYSTRIVTTQEFLEYVDGRQRHGIERGPEC